MKSKDEIEEMRDKVCYLEKSRLDKELSGMTYAEGVDSALEWVLGRQTDADLLNK